LYRSKRVANFRVNRHAENAYAAESISAAAGHIASVPSRAVVAATQDSSAAVKIVALRRLPKNDNLGERTDVAMRIRNST
jgi:hypothetical protein